MKTLILLVGTNPLPNYVVASYFKAKEGYEKLVLIHSSGTQNIATRLANSLGKDKCSLIPIADDDLKYQGKVSAKLLKEFSTLKRDGSDLHLHYAGDTAMAVQASLACKELGILPVNFSYLNSSNFKIYTDNDDFFPENGNLLSEVSIDLDTLLRLHAAEIVKNEIPRKPNETEMLKEAFRMEMAAICSAIPGVDTRGVNTTLEIQRGVYPHTSLVRTRIGFVRVDGFRVTVGCFATGNADEVAGQALEALALARTLGGDSFALVVITNAKDDGGYLQTMLQMAAGDGYHPINIVAKHSLPTLAGVLTRWFEKLSW